MSTSGENAIHEIQADLACPQCQYNLRGLRGEVVSCPECGAVCDVAKLIATRWEKPWYTAPLFNLLALPVAWGIGCFVVLLILLAEYANITQHRSFPLALVAGFWAGCLLGWLVTMYHVRRRWGNWQGVRLAALAHLVVSGYITGVIGFVISIFATLGDVADLIAASRGSWGTALIGLITRLSIVAAFFALVYVCRRIERYMGEQCIRRYVRQAGGTPGPG